MAEFSPVARVLDIYQAPTMPTIGGPTIGAGSQWEDLARSLAAYHRPLDTLLTREMNEGIEEEMAEGQRLQQEHRIAFKDAVNKGLIPEGSNPYLRMGYMKSELRLKGQEFRTHILDTWNQDGEIQNADADAIPAWASEKTSAWRQANLAGYDDKLVQEVFDPVQEAGLNQLVQHHIGNSFQRASERSREALEQEIGALAGDTDTYDLSAIAQENPGLLKDAKDESSVRTGFLASRVQSLLDEAVANGMSGSDANAIAIAQIAGAAELTGNRDVLNSLNHIQTGSGSLGQTAKAKQAIMRVDEAISNRQIRDENLWWSRRERARTEERRAVISGFSKLLIENTEAGGIPTADPIEWLRASGTSDPEIMADVIQMHNTLTTAAQKRLEIPDDPEGVRQVYSGMYSGTIGPREIIAANGAGLITTDTMVSALRDQRYIEDYNADPVVNSPAFKQMLDGVESGAKSILGGGFGVEADNGTQARLDLLNISGEWRLQNPEGTLAQHDAAMREEMVKISKHYREMGALNPTEPVAPMTGQAATPQPQQAAPAAAPPPVEQTPVEETAPEPAPRPVPPQTGFPTPPKAAIDFLLANASDTNILNQFNAKYGPGAAAAALGVGAEQ